MANTAKQYIMKKTGGSLSRSFMVSDSEAEEHGGILGQMTGQGYLARIEKNRGGGEAVQARTGVAPRSGSEYQLTLKGERWLAPMLKE